MLHYFHNLTFATFATFATLTFSIHLRISKKVVLLQHKLKDRLTTVRPLTLKDPLRTPSISPKTHPKIRDFRGPRKGGE